MEQLNYIIRNLSLMVALITWMMGIVLAKGVWLTFTSACFPFYAWYLVIERLMMLSGFI